MLECNGLCGDLAERRALFRLCEDLSLASHLRRRVSANGTLARELDAWSRRVECAWHTVGFLDVATQAAGGCLTVIATVTPGQLDHDSIRVEIYADSIDGDESFVQPLTRVDDAGAAAPAARYRTTIATERPPDDFTVRVVPYHPEARLPLECALITWQR